MERFTKPVYITVLSGKSKRIPNKNMIIVNGKPLLQYTIDFVKKLKRQYSLKYYIISDSEKIEEYVISRRINHLMIPEYTGDRNHAKGMQIMRWMHRHINAQSYFMLPATTPTRNLKRIADIIAECLCGFVKSATTVYKTDRNNYKHTGEFWFFEKDQLKKKDLIDNNTRLFITNNNIDIDTVEDLIRFKRFVDGN